MNIELRNVKYAAFASRETSCFTATIYVDGVKAGDARNEGHGGCTFIEPRALNDKIEAYAQTLPAVNLSGLCEDAVTIPNCAEQVIDHLLNNFLVARDLKKAMSKRILFMRGRQILKYGPLKPDALAAQLRDPAAASKLTADRILNLMPFAEALVLYRSVPTHR